MDTPKPTSEEKFSRKKGSRQPPMEKKKANRRLLARKPKQRVLMKEKRASQGTLEELVVDRAGISNNAKRLLSLGLTFVPNARGHANLDEEIINAAHKAKGKIDKRFRKALRAPENTISSAGSPELFNKILQAATNKSRHHNNGNNLSQKEEKGLKELKTNSEVVIKKADKGASVVILPKEEYEREAIRQLSDTTTYKALTPQNAEEIFQQTQKESQQLLLAAKAEGILAPKQLQEMLAEKAKMPNWYILPKIHKAIREDTGAYPGRPILSGCSAANKPVDRLLAKQLTPLLAFLERRLKDTKAFLQHLASMKRSLPTDTILYSFDVESLYPSIPQQEAIEIVVKFFQKHKHKIKGRKASTEWIREALNLVVGSNIFQFNGQHYQQVKGTAMGTSISVALAEIYVYTTIEENPFIKSNIQWKRYIDDIFGIHQGSEEKLLETFRKLNTINPALKFTMELSRERITFLDTEVYIDGSRKLQTTIHYKESDLHQYLHANSSHPRSTKKSLPYSQGLRIKRIVSDPKILKQEINKLMEFFRRRGYSQTILTEAKERLSLVTRKQLLGPSKNKQIGDRDIYVFTYNPSTHRAINKGLRDIYKWAGEWYNEEPFTTLNSFPPQAPMTAWKRNKNLKNILVRAQYPQRLG